MRGRAVPSFVLNCMYMIEKDVISQLVEKLASSDNYLVDVVIKPGSTVIIEIDNDEVFVSTIALS